jgi:hypothetical protein
MLRTHSLSSGYDLIDPAMKEAPFDVPLYHEVAQLPDVPAAPTR